MKYAKLISKLATPQTRPIFGSGQGPNHASGYAWEVDPWNILDRFLILGSEDGTYYVEARTLTIENAENLRRLIELDGPRVVKRLVEVSVGGLAPKNDPAIFALALCASFGDDQTRAIALRAMPEICRTGTHLFAFADACDGFRGWGRGLRKAVGNWYSDKSVAQLELQLVKYKQRDGWSHRDLLRLAHPCPQADQQKALYRLATAGEISDFTPLAAAAKRLTEVDLGEAVGLIEAMRIPREAIPTELLREPKVWMALLKDMPLTALIRNLGNLGKLDLLAPHGEAVGLIESALDDRERLKKARLHPVAILSALLTYASGKGVKGDGHWDPNPRIMDALDRAFYGSFESIRPTGKRLLLGLDVSGSMVGTRVAGVSHLDCRRAAGTMALVTSSVEQEAKFVAFDTAAYPLAISARQRLDDVVSLLSQIGGGGTDCAQPILYAMKKKIQVDAFVLYTDSETWSGSIHPAQAVQRYRAEMGIAAKLVVVAMASTRTSIGDPGDPGTMNVVGFDASAPDVISQFIRG